jgi:hypothetical protein
MCSLRLTVRFASIAEARWYGRMLNQFHQHDHSKRTFLTARVARASILVLNNVQNIFTTRLREWTIYKCVFNRLSWRKYQDVYQLIKSAALRISNKYQINTRGNVRLNCSFSHRDNYFNNLVESILLFSIV